MGRNKACELDNLLIGYLPVITKPTRITDHSATLLDHIYSNSKSLNYQSGIIITDVADHFGTFYVSRKNHLNITSVVTIPDFAMRCVSRYLGHDAIHIAILVYRVSQSLDLQFVYDGGAIQCSA